jgi:hypothetical protein
VCVCVCVSFWCEYIRGGVLVEIGGFGIFYVCIYIKDKRDMYTGTHTYIYTYTHINLREREELNYGLRVRHGFDW